MVACVHVLKFDTEKVETLYNIMNRFYKKYIHVNLLTSITVHPFYSLINPPLRFVDSLFQKSQERIDKDVSSYVFMQWLYMCLLLSLGWILFETGSTIGTMLSISSFEHILENIFPKLLTTGSITALIIGFVWSTTFLREGMVISADVLHGFIALMVTISKLVSMYTNLGVVSEQFDAIVLLLAQHVMVYMGNRLYGNIECKSAVVIAHCALSTGTTLFST